MFNSGRLVCTFLVKVAELATSLEAAKVCCWLSLIRAGAGVELPLVSAKYTTDQMTGKIGTFRKAHC